MNNAAALQMNRTIDESLRGSCIITPPTISSRSACGSAWAYGSAVLTANRRSLAR